MLLLWLFIYMGIPEDCSGTLMQPRLLTSCQNSSFLAPSHEILFGILCIVTLSHPNSDHHLSIVIRILLPSLQLICCLDTPLETLFVFYFFRPHSKTQSHTQENGKRYTQKLKSSANLAFSCILFSCSPNAFALPHRKLSSFITHKALVCLITLTISGSWQN